MSRGVGHGFEVCRNLYFQCRQNGAPVVHIHDLGGDIFFSETADGKLHNESATGCCKWAMKFELASEWLEKSDLDSGRVEVVSNERKWCSIQQMRQELDQTVFDCCQIMV